MKMTRDLFRDATAVSIVVTDVPTAEQKYNAYPRYAVWAPKIAWIVELYTAQSNALMWLMQETLKATAWYQPNP